MVSLVHNGIIISNTINDSSIVYIAARVIHKFGLKTPMERLYDKHHLNHFSNNSLEYLHKKNSLNMWIVSDNLLRGAALNAVEIAEAYIKR